MGELFAVITCIAAIHLDYVLANYTEATPSEENDGPLILENYISKSALSLASIGVFILIGAGVAKFADMCHDQVRLRDNASDISEYTRGLLKARLAILSLKSGRKLDSVCSASEIELARTYGRKWLFMAAAKKHRKTFNVVKAQAEALEDVEDPIYFHPSQPVTTVIGQAGLNLMGYQPGRNSITPVEPLMELSVTPDMNAQPTSASTPKRGASPRRKIQEDFVTVDLTPVTEAGGAEIERAADDNVAPKANAICRTLVPQLKISVSSGTDAFGSGYGDDHILTENKATISGSMASVGEFSVLSDGTEVLVCSDSGNVDQRPPSAKSESPSNAWETDANKNEVAKGTKKTKNGTAAARTPSDAKSTAVRPVTAGKSRIISEGCRPVKNSVAPKPTP